eukprot:tig00020960_g16593.t1
MPGASGPARAQNVAALAALVSLLTVPVIFWGIPKQTKHKVVSIHPEDDPDADPLASLHPDLLPAPSSDAPPKPPLGPPAAPAGAPPATSPLRLGRFTRLLQSKEVRALLIVKAISGFPFAMFQTIFSIAAVEQFQLNPQQNGYVLSYVGVVSIIVQGAMVGALVRRYPEHRLMVLSCASMGVSFVAMSACEGIITLCVCMLPCIFGGTLIVTIITSALTKAVPPSDSGTILGFNMAANSGLRIIAPSLGGFLYANMGFNSINWFGFIANGALAAYLALGPTHDSTSPRRGPASPVKSAR